MNADFNPDFESLKNNIIEVIEEEQIKLGFREETIRLYYPMESLNHLLGAELSMNELLDALNRFCIYVKKYLGDVAYSYKDTRFCMIIPPSGASYVHANTGDKSFLKEFIERISTCHGTIEDILTVFQNYSDRVKYEKMSGEDFDYLIYFEDEKPDAYRYCIKFEGDHTIYHRFTKADYDSFGF